MSLHHLRLAALLRRLVPLALPLCLGLSACDSDSDARPGGQSATDPSEVAFHADVSALPGVNKDTGLQPASSPVQLQLKVSASGSGAIDAAAYASGSPDGPTLAAKSQSGTVSVEGGFALEGRLVANVPGLPSYDGAVPGLQNVKIAFSNQTSFDPFLLGGSAVAKAAIPPTDLPPIPLPGGIPGSLKIKVAEGSTVNLEFTGVCAAIQGDQAQYTGQVVRSGSLILKPRVEVEIPIVGTKGYDIPDITVPISVPAQQVDLGTKTVVFGAPGLGGEEAKVGTCEAVPDGGTAGSAGQGGAAGQGNGGAAGQSTGGAGGQGNGGAAGQGTGGSSAGGSNTGGNHSGGSHTGGTSSGGSHTGGSNTGGSNPCWELDPEPNGTYDSAPYIGIVTDCESEAMILHGTLADGNDHDWFSFVTTDSPTCYTSPMFTIEPSPNLWLCAYFRCTSGDTLITCSADSVAYTSPGGDMGCCTTTGSLTPSVDCDWTTDESGIGWVEVFDDTVQACSDYMLYMVY